MPHIDTLLPLYPDTATRRTLLEQALDQTRSDLADTRHAIRARNHAAARQYVHRAKGTVSFLGSGNALPAFDRLTEALRARDEPGIEQAYALVETALLELEAALRARLDALPDAPPASRRG
ncbi:hypothetical protein [Bordetella petrii]|uniref:hypothetical protein n=1 Tax=Bordetella petrii TaxID=94624 RepID=UPI001A97A489|nr:hypothetical protein [Bordetella petrii]MBO1111675.1 hypothetical protein [Bordetella petrii]